MCSGSSVLLEGLPETGLMFGDEARLLFLTDAFLPEPTENLLTDILECLRIGLPLNFEDPLPFLESGLIGPSFLAHHA